MKYFFWFPFALCACKSTLPADLHYARTVAISVDEGDRTCAAHATDQAVLARCAALRKNLKALLLNADTP